MFILMHSWNWPLYWILIFSKFEEIYPPELSEFVYVTDDTYSQKQILRMEHLVLKVLSFDVAIPTANLFLEKYLKDANADEKTKSLAMVCYGCFSICLLWMFI